jgi:hypothetical protein
MVRAREEQKITEGPALWKLPKKSVISKTPNTPLADVHDRMPVIHDYPVVRGHIAGPVCEQTRMAAAGVWKRGWTYSKTRGRPPCPAMAYSNRRPASRVALRFPRAETTTPAVMMEAPAAPRNSRLESARFLRSGQAGRGVLQEYTRPTPRATVSSTLESLRGLHLLLFQGPCRSHFRFFLWPIFRFSA